MDPNRARHVTGSRYHAVYYGSLGNTSKAHYSQAQTRKNVLYVIVLERLHAGAAAAAPTLVFNSNGYTLT
ncbi:hypothetical protein T492DRAFT_913578 [Pavlovales sp. CCMP2436]|nr:hypothetical protein T492DRAFT_913578 [Pavlovales sp. CCMP2436]